MENGSLMKVESIADGSNWSILQYLWPELSGNQYWKPSLMFFLSGRLRQILPYITKQATNTNNGSQNKRWINNNRITALEQTLAEVNGGGGGALIYIPGKSFALDSVFVKHKAKAQTDKHSNIF